MVLVLATINISPEPHLTKKGAHSLVHAIKKVDHCVNITHIIPNCAKGGLNPHVLIAVLNRTLIVL